MESLTSRKVVELVRERAIEKWGSRRWLAGLCEAYTAAESQITGQEIKPAQRKPQLHRLFNEPDSKMNLETAMLLLKSVDGEINVIFHNPKLIKL